MEGDMISYGKKEQGDIDKMIELAKEKELNSWKENCVRIQI